MSVCLDSTEMATKKELDTHKNVAPIELSLNQYLFDHQSGLGPIQLHIPSRCQATENETGRVARKE